MTKKEISHLIANGELRPALNAALEYATQCQFVEQSNALSVLSSNLALQQHQWNTGQVSFEEFSRAHARQSASLTELLAQLPDSPALMRQTRMLDEHRYKWRIFRVFVICKMFVLGRLFYHWSHGGFSREEFFSTLTLLGAALVAHSMVMFDDLLNQTHDGKRRFVSGTLARTVQIVNALYAIGLFLAIEWKAMSRLSFAEMNTMLTIVETLLGGYVGKVVARFFKNNQ